MSRVFFDCETDGLLDVATKCHCLVVDGGTILSCHDGQGLTPIGNALEKLSSAQEIVGHNIICFDIPVLTKIYPTWKTSAKIIDTLLLSRMLYPEIENFDMIKGIKDKEFLETMKEHKCIGKHSLKAWGIRLGVLKGNFGETTDWKEWSPEMQSYCKQDVIVTKELYNFLTKKHISWEAYDLEYEFQLYIHEQEQHGCHFNVGKAIQLKQRLVLELEEVKNEIKKTVPDWIEETTFIPKRDNKKAGYKMGVPIIRRHHIPFNPNSRMQIEKFLKKKYDWEPSELTKTGRAKINSDILDELEELKWVEAQHFSKFLVITKLLGYISEGDNAWLKLVTNGKIHGGMITCGALTRRCTHNKPNLGQVPSVKKYLGRECRELFEAPAGWKFVGADLSGIELRCFAHYLFPYDNGLYAETILRGDIHVKNQKDAGLPTRDNAKTFIYGLLYGAGNAKIGMITHAHETKEKRTRIGSTLKNNFCAANPAYDKLNKLIKNTLKVNGYIRGIDGHRLTPRQEHAAMNTLFQNCGAVIAKRACVIFRREMIKREWWLTKVKPCLQVHDEAQVISRPDISDEVGKTLVNSMRLAGEFYKFNMPIAGEYKIGNNWKETH